MLYHTTGIVLKTIDYNDKYLLVPILTKDFGKVTYLVSKSKSKSSKVKRVIFRPLAVLNLTVSHHNNKEVHNIKEAQLVYLQNTIAPDINKTAIIFFLSDFLSKVLQESHKDENLFAFLKNCMELLEFNAHSIANYHLVFLIKLSHFLGFYPHFDSYVNNSYFDMLNGEFVQHPPLHNQYLNIEESANIHLLRRITFANMHHFKFKQKERRDIIEKIIEYYRIHTYEFSTLKSLEVLHDIF